jgi:DnaJ family protein A protein 2
MKEEDRCSECQGKKVLEKEKTLQVGIEPGVPNEHDYVFTGESDEYVTLVP